MKRVGVLTHPDCLLHSMGEFHPECPRRLTVISAAIEQSEIVSKISFYKAPFASFEQIMRVHDADYVNEIVVLSPEVGLTYLDPDTALNPYSLNAARYAAGAAVCAVDLIMDKTISRAFCNIRPPGHHATKNQAMGFCIFNNIAVAVAHALEFYQLKRVAIVDFDVHHGNGTQDIFLEDDRVMLCSLFQHPFYPYTGAECNKSHILNIPLPARTTGSLLRDKVQNQWLPALSDFKPEMLFFSAGFDGHRADDMANFMLTESDYAWLTAESIKATQDSSLGRVVSCLEGGYALSVLGECVVAHLRALIDT